MCFRCATYDCWVLFVVIEIIVVILGLLLATKRVHYSGVFKCAKSSLQFPAPTNLARLVQEAYSGPDGLLDQQKFCLRLLPVHTIFNTLCFRLFVVIVCNRTVNALEG